MHKNVVVALSLLFSFVSCSANPSESNSSNPEVVTVQQADPMNFSEADAPFSVSFSTNEAKVGDVIELIFKANIADGLYIYGVITDCDVGPQPPRFEALNLTGFEKLGNIYHGIKHKMVADEIFECNYSKFTHKVEFRQKVKVTSANAKVSGDLFFQMCSDQLCKSFNYLFDLNGPKISEAAAQPKADDNKTDDSPKVDTKPEQDDKNDTQASENQEDDSVSSPWKSEKEGGSDEGEEKTDKAKKDKESDKAYGAATEGNVKDMSLWALFILGVGGGLFALLTPCVYPMIPMTVAYFTKEEDKAKGKKKALVYGASILGIYMVAGVALAAIFGKGFAYMLSTHWLPNMLFFLVFVIFALSFFGMFELTLPSGFVNRMDSKGGKGGYLGVFFIALTLVLVSFSCTAPIVGSIGFLSADGELMKAVAAMAGFAITFALPFTLFAFFPAWLTNLPQSGGWLNVVKVVLGFVELALAFKFLSQADLAYHWNILDRHVFLSIWIVLSFLLGVYLLGKIKFPHDSDVDRLPVPRFLFATSAFVFALYMVPGLWGAPLKPLSGFIPPMHTQDFVLGGDNGHTNGNSNNGHQANSSDIRFSDFLHSPIKGFTAYFDYNQALEVAKKEKKLIFVDFTGHTCANCRKMEADVLTDERIQKAIADNMIILSLYCDEWINEYPEGEWVTTESGSVLKSIGSINQHRQENQFGSSGQPFYYMINWEGERHGGVWGGYKNDKDAYLSFLNEGIADFNEWKKKQ